MIDELSNGRFMMARDWRIVSQSCPFALVLEVTHTYNDEVLLEIMVM